ncbi:hypothetical protein MUA04_20655 [Enterobacteriaceae bacterium H11S18]|uniref:hypothetical protein n=1 Tax=Dryocola clanedunensis TaxID=2925396 RepID=UPI0022EFF4C7|nr:hypothetical protein [Dryocola clanedunensis]MCT4707074.1 hypothetical protein [Dryocola clanedunensis]MCT4712585.1 hypothetical protein [Dryocola clanedunensis]
MMQMFKYPHGEGECRSRIDYDGPVVERSPIFILLDPRLTPSLSRFAKTTISLQTSTCMGGLCDGD